MFPGLNTISIALAAGALPLAKLTALSMPLTGFYRKASREGERKEREERETKEKEECQKDGKGKGGRGREDAFAVGALPLTPLGKLTALSLPPSWIS